MGGEGERWKMGRGGLKGGTSGRDREISTCGWIIEVYSVQYNDGEISTCG